MPASASSSSRLAVAGDAGDADDLALAQRRRRRRRRASTPRSSRTTRLRASSTTLPGCAAPLSILRMTLRPTIASASSGGEVSAVSKVATISPRRITETRSVRLMISRSLWVMKMIVLFCALEHAQHLEQLVGLGGRQHRGRLVEHQDFRAAHQRLEDLDPLLQADRQFADDRVGIDLEPVFLGRARASSCAIAAAPSASSGPPSAPSMTFSSTLSGGTSMKC